MGMQTVIKNKEGEKITIITQWYEGIGELYCAAYKEGVTIPDQFASRMKEIPFHKKLRKSNPDFIVDDSTEIK